MRVLQLGRGLDLSKEALPAEQGADCRVEHFQGDEALMTEVAGEINGRHPPAPELALEGVAVA